MNPDDTDPFAKAERTRRKAGSGPLKEPDDSVAMTEAIDCLSVRGVPVRRVSPIQLKIGALNYCPDAGTIYRDGEERMRERDLAGLNQVLRRIAGVSELPLKPPRPH